MSEWYRPNDLIWWALCDLAEELDALSAGASNTLVLTQNFNLVGKFAEWVYEQVTGLEMSWEIAIADGGIDFKDGTDVKGTQGTPPLLMIPKSRPLKARQYYLVSVDLEQRRGRPLGYATREMLFAAPLGDPYNKGFPARILGEPDLIPSLA